MRQSSPPLMLHVYPQATPTPAHRPPLVPHQWQEAVLAGLNRDVHLGLLESVPPNTSVTWQSSIILSAKHEGTPLRTIDYLTLNADSPMHVQSTSSPWLLVSSVPNKSRKSRFDVRHCHHSLLVALEQDRAAKSFTTPWGHFRYRTCPQGLWTHQDAYSTGTARTGSPCTCQDSDAAPMTRCTMTTP